MEFDYDQETGHISNRRELLPMDESIGGIFDGATADANSDLWWAIFKGSKIIKINPSQQRVV